MQSVFTEGKQYWKYDYNNCIMNMVLSWSSEGLQNVTDKIVTLTSIFSLKTWYSSNITLY